MPNIDWTDTDSFGFSEVTPGQPSFGSWTDLERVHFLDQGFLNYNPQKPFSVSYNPVRAWAEYEVFNG